MYSYSISVVCLFKTGYPPLILEGLELGDLSFPRAAIKGVHHNAEPALVPLRALANTVDKPTFT